MSDDVLYTVNLHVPLLDFARVFGGIVLGFMIGQWWHGRKR